MQKHIWIVVTLTMMLWCTGCGGKTDEAIPDIPDVEEDTGPAVEPDTYVPPSPLGKCDLVMESPAVDLHVGGPGDSGQLVIRGRAVYKKPQKGGTVLEVDMEKAGGFLKENNPADADSAGSQNLDVLSYSDWTDGAFEWVIDVSGKPTGEYTVIVQAVTEEGPEGEPAAACDAEIPIFIDNSCPLQLIFKPYDAAHPNPDPKDLNQGMYVENLDFRVAFKDDTGIETVELYDSEQKLVKSYTEGLGGPFADQGSNDQLIADQIDVCRYGTGNETFTMKITDTLGNQCDTSNEELGLSRSPWIVRCPHYVTPNVYEDTTEASRVVAYDVATFEKPADGHTDVVTVGSKGVFVFFNDGTGKLGKPVPMKNIDGSATFVHPGDFDSNGLTDFFVVTEQALEIYLQDKVCEKDPEFDASELEEDELPEKYPMVCEEGFALVESHPTSAAVSATFMSDISKDQQADGEDLEVSPDNLKEFLLGTEEGQYTLGVMIRHEGLNSWESPGLDSEGKPALDEDGNPVIETKTAGWCRYWKPSYDIAGDLIPPLAHEETRCFYPPNYFGGAGNIVDINVGDYFTNDAKNLQDIIVAWENYVSVFKNEGNGIFKISHAQVIPKPDPMESTPRVTRVIPGSFDSADLPEVYTDALILLAESNQVWTIFGDGSGGWRQALNSQTKIKQVERRATCIEGELSDIAMGNLDDVDEDGPQTVDIVVSNKTGGTVWSMYSVGTGASGTAFYDPAIINGLGGASTVELAKMNDDDYLDLVLFSQSTKELAVVLGANPTLPAKDPNYGQEGRFVGAINTPTLIPTQDPGATNRCSSSIQPSFKATDPMKQWKAYEGSPQDRLKPEFMAFGDFWANDGDVDFVMMTEQTGVWTGNPDELGDPRHVLFTYAFGGKAPTIFVDRTYYMPHTAYCTDKLAPPPDDLPEGEEYDVNDPENYKCPSDVGPPKGNVTGFAGGKVNTGLDQDLLIATATTWTPPPPGESKETYPELPTVDVMVGKSNGLYDQVELTPTTNDVLSADAPPGEWHDLGFSTCSNPRELVATYCDGDNDPLMDMIVLCDRYLVDEQPPTTHLYVYKSQGSGQNFFPYEVAPVPYGKMLRVAVLGTPSSDPNDLNKNTDTTLDILVAEKSNVKTFQGVGFCTFSSNPTTVTMGPELVSMAVGDLDKDGLADLMTPLSNGRIAVAYGIYGAEGNNFDAPDQSLDTKSNNLGASEVADINGDGYLDLLVLDRGGSSVIGYLNDGGGKLWPIAHRLHTGREPTQLVALDLNKDNCTDIATLSPSAKAASFLMNRVGQIGTCKSVDETDED